VRESEEDSPDIPVAMILATTQPNLLYLGPHLSWVEGWFLLEFVLNHQW